MQINFPCVCGHLRVVHHTIASCGEWLVCMCKGIDTLTDDCNCYQFKPDNLKFLECESERKEQSV